MTKGYTKNGITVAGGNGFVYDISGNSTANNQVFPASIIVDGSGNLYVADFGGERILKFPPNSTSATNGAVVAGGNRKGTAANQFFDPSSIFIDGGGNLYVCERGNNRVQKFPPGSTASTLGTTLVGNAYSGGSAANQLLNPSSVFVDAQGSMYVADLRNNRIQKFLSGSAIGITVAGGNGNGSAANQLGLPSGVVVDALGNIYVADANNNRIQKFPSNSTSSTNGITIAGGNGAGAAANQFNNSNNLFIDSNRNLYVADAGNSRIQKFPSGSTSFTNGTTVAGGNGSGSSANQFNGCYSVCLDGSGNVLVADYLNNRVQKFLPTTTGIDTAFIPTTPGTYYAVVTDTSGCTFTTNAFIILPTVTPTITITSTANTTPPCTQVVNAFIFTATTTHSGTAPTFQWQVNGVNAGTNDSTFTATFTNKDLVTCILTSNALCVVTPTVTSNIYSVYFKPPLVANLQNNSNICLGSDTLTINSINNIYNLKWYNGAALDTSITATVLTNSMLNGVTVAGGNGYGPASSQIYPKSVFVDNSGTLFVGDYGNARVQKFAAGSSSVTNGTTAAGGNGQSSAANAFYQPAGVFVDGNGYLYVADNILNRIQKFPPGSTGATNGITVAGGNGTGSAANQFNGCNALFLDATGNIYVADASNSRIQKFPPNSSSTTNGVTVAGGNGFGPAANQLSNPSSVVVDGSGYIYVDDNLNNRIQKFPPNSSRANNGITIAGGNGSGKAANQLDGPMSICLDGAGNIYVDDILNSRIQKFPANSTSATNGITVAGGNGQGAAANQLYLPSSIFVDVTGYIYVADEGNNRVQKFAQQFTINHNYVPKTSGTYTTMVTDTAGCSVTTNAITIYPPVTPAINIVALSAVPNACAQAIDTLTFQATASNGGSLPNYQWQVNGINAGTNSIMFTNIFTAKSLVTCVLTSNAVCATPAINTSNIYSVSFGKPPVATLISKTNICLDFDTLSISSSTNGSIATIAWYNGGQLNNTVTAVVNVKVDTTKLPTAPGSYTATVTDSLGCFVTTNAVNLAPTIKPSIIISANKASVCAGNTIVFTAIASNTSASPIYKWQVNGNLVGTSSAVYSNSSLANSDTVTCVMSNGIGCAEKDTSNLIVAAISPLPIVGSAIDLPIMLGQSVALNIPVMGNITSYLWSPAASLSSNIVVNPVATPIKTTVYLLKVISVDSCVANGTITVKVSFLIHIPTGFTPNGDGVNDVFYVLGGMDGDLVKDFSIFNRWGKRMFQVQNVLPNDHSSGWDGSYNGTLQQSGSYIYMATVVSANGTEQVYKGSVVLVR